MAKAALVLALVLASPAFAEDAKWSGAVTGYYYAMRDEPDFGVGVATGLNDLVDHQIAVSGSRRADGNRFIRHLNVQRVAVSLGIDGDRLDPHAARSLDDPAGDLAAIGDQNSFEHVLFA